MSTHRPLAAEELESDAVDPRELARAAGALRPSGGEVMQKLLEDLERSEAPAEGSAWPPILEEPRRRVDTRYADPATSHRPLVGPVLVVAKRSFRAVFQPFINEVLRRQVEFNEALLGSLAGIYEQLRVNARTQALWREEVEQRLKALETPPAPPKRPASGRR